MAAFPVSPEVAASQLKVLRSVLDKWVLRFEEGIPSVDLPGSDEAFDRFVTECQGELRMVAGATDALAEVIGESSGSRG